MKILLAAFLYTGLMVARANTQEDKTSLRSLYPGKAASNIFISDELEC